VLDFAEGLNGEIYVATDGGLSVFDNGWTTLRTTTPLANGSILSNHVLAVETDHRGFVWVGYTDGLQILAGPEIITIRDQQFLKNLNINTLYRNGEDMWVATGSSGVHRWRNGTWHHVSPWGEEGLGAYEVRSMAADPESGALYVASADSGVWVAPTGRDPLRFTRLLAHVPGDSPGIGLRADPFGGIYLFNRTTILHFSDRGGIQQVRFAPDLVAADVPVYDMAISRNGIVWIATGNGIYGCAEGKVVKHLTAPDGIGSDAVKRIYADRQGRVWFVTTEAVGYLPSVLVEGTPIPVHIVETTGTGSTTAPVPVGPEVLPLPPTPQITVTILPGPGNPSPDSFPGFVDDLRGWLGDLFARDR
jgi:ligand-binding sensor domain-containing protein